MASAGEALRALIEAEGARGGGVRSSYKAKSWSAQVHHMQRTRAGRDKLAGLASARTVKAWAAGRVKTGPSKANRAAIAKAYRGLAGSFPEHLKGANLVYDGPSPWASDPRTHPTINLGLGGGIDWDAIADAWEDGGGDLDADAWDDLFYEHVFDHDLGQTSPVGSAGGGVTLAVM